MAARPRKRKHKGLVTNLYLRKGIYYYRRPDNGKEFSMGRNLKMAKEAAIELNNRLMPSADLVATVMGLADISINDACDEFQQVRIDDDPRLAPSTKKEKTYRLNRIRKDLGHYDIAKFTTADVANWLENIKGDAYRQHRTTLSQVMDFAQTRGWIHKNVVSPTLSHDVHYKKVRKRLTVEQYQAVRGFAEPWLQVAMDLALLTCQGRTEIVNMAFDHIEDDTLYVVRQKTYRKTETAYIAISITPTLAKVIERSRQLPPASPLMVHRRPERMQKSTRHGNWSVTASYLSKAFQKARDQVSSIARMPEEERPTFHEIRALGAHLMEKAGVKKAEVQALLGHADESMTEVYLAGHDQKWISAVAGDFEVGGINKY